MSVKAQQVLRTVKQLRSENGVSVPAAARVVVMKMIDDARVRVKVMDPNHPDLRGSRLVAALTAFNLTHRGRPPKNAKSE